LSSWISEELAFFAIAHIAPHRPLADITVRAPLLIAALERGWRPYRMLVEVPCGVLVGWAGFLAMLPLPGIRRCSVGEVDNDAFWGP
jgi:hypothetical protein